MATIANWNGHTFVVSPSLIRGFTDMSIKSGCEVTEKNTDNQKYLERKYGEIPEISMTVGLNAQTGVTDVYGEAMEYIAEATDGATAYFYMGSSKLLPAKMMLTTAEVVEIVTMPGQGAKWISCDVKLTFKQGSKNDESTGGGGGSGKKKSVKGKGVIGKAITTGDATTTNLNTVKALIDAAKANEKSSARSYLDGVYAAVDKATATASNSAAKTNATTSRYCEFSQNKITRIPNYPVGTNVR